MALFDSIRNDLDEAREKYGMQKKPSLFNGSSPVTPMGPRSNGISRGITSKFQDSPETVIPFSGGSAGGDFDEMNEPLQYGDGDEPTSEKKGGFLSGLSKGQTNQTDETGAPVRDKPSIFKTISDVALPTLFSAVSGAGILPGLMTGLAGRQAGIENKYRADMDDYQVQQKIKNDLDLSREKSADAWNIAQLNAGVKRDNQIIDDSNQQAQDEASRQALIEIWNSDPGSLSVKQKAQLKYLLQKR